MDDDDFDDEKLKQALQYFLDHPDDPARADFDRVIRSVLLDPRYHQSLVERIGRDELAPEIMDMLVAHARDPRPTEGRAHARRVLSEAWKVDDPIH